MRNLAIAFALATLGCGSNAPSGANDANVDAVDTSVDSHTEPDASDVAEGESGPDPNGPIAVVPGYSHTCVLTRARRVRCWGLYGPGLTPQPPIPGIVNVLELAVAAAQTCVRLKSNDIRCWGDARVGLLGDGVLPGPASVTTPTMIPGLSGIRQIGLTYVTAVAALANNGTVWTWGANSLDQLGYVTSTNCGLGDPHTCSATPTAVPGIGAIKQLALAMTYMCALSESGVVTCWGNGDPLSASSGGVAKTPVIISDLGPVESIISGTNWTCAREVSGKVKCWFPSSWNFSAIAMTPMELKGTPTQIAVGNNNEVCLLVAGVAQCMKFGDLALSPKPGLPTNVVKLGGGPRSMCAITSDDGLYCWGGGPLGDGKLDSSTWPVKVLW